MHVKTVEVKDSEKPQRKSNRSCFFLFVFGNLLFIVKALLSILKCCCLASGGEGRAHISVQLVGSQFDNGFCYVIYYIFGIPT